MWWVIGDYKYWRFLSPEEREKLKTWDVNLYKDHRELNDRGFIGAHLYS
jgi:hypothetical protein